MVNQSQFIEDYYNRYEPTNLGAHISVIRGVSYKPTDIRETGDDAVAILRSNNISDGEINYEDIVYVSPTCVSEKQFLDTGDIVMCGSNGSKKLVGKAGLIAGKQSSMSFGAFCLGIRCKETLAPEYLNAYFNSRMYRSIIEELGNGTNIINIRPDHITSLSIPVPEKNVQNEFVMLSRQADKSKFAGFKSQFISQFGFPQDGDVKHPTSSIESLLEETISGEWGTDCADDSGTRVIRTTNFTNDGVLNLDDVVLRSIDQKKVEKKHLHKGDIILEKSGGTKDNPVGRLVYFAEDGIYLANNFTQVLRPSNSVNSRYLFAALYYLYQTHKPLIKGLGNQTNGIQNLKVPQYLQLQVCVPDRKEQDAFEQVLQRADKSKYLN